MPSSVRGALASAAAFAGSANRRMPCSSAIGVSGGSAPQDGQVAKAGIDALK